MNFLPGRLEGDMVKLPFGDAKLPDELRRLQGAAAAASDVIVGIRPEPFEDAASRRTRMRTIKFKTKVDVVESMGSELYVYFDVEGEDVESAELSELAADAGMEDLP